MDVKFFIIILYSLAEVSRLVDRFFFKGENKMNIIEEIIKNQNNDDNNIFEMATLRKSKSNLPVNLYLDDSGSYLRGGHSPRIKFQANKGDHPNTRGIISMTISDDPEIPIDDYKNKTRELDESDIVQIKKFVILNKDNLLRLCDIEDNYDFSDFSMDMKKL